MVCYPYGNVLFAVVNRAEKNNKNFCGHRVCSQGGWRRAGMGFPEEARCHNHPRSLPILRHPPFLMRQEVKSPLGRACRTAVLFPGKNEDRHRSRTADGVASLAVRRWQCRPSGLGC